MNLLNLSGTKIKHNELLKVIAIIAMVIDHIGFMFFPEHIEFRILGRIAFPIFAFQLAKGYLHTSNKNQYLSRLWVFALLSQIPYTLYFETFNLNILFTLIISLFLIDRIHKKEWYWIFPIAFLSFLPRIAPDLPTFDYGWYGILTPLAFYFLSLPNQKFKLLLAQVALTGLYVWSGETFEVQWFALIGVLIVLYLPLDKWKVYLNKSFFYWFYPAHLAFLLLLKIAYIFLIASP